MRRLLAIRRGLAASCAIAICGCPALLRVVASDVARAGCAQAGRHRDVGRHVHPGPAAGRGAEHGRLLHEDRGDGRLRRHGVPPGGAQRHGAGRRSAVEGSGEEGAVRHGRAEPGEGRGARGEDARAARWPPCWCPGSPTAPARSSSSCWPISPRSTTSTPCSQRWPTAWRCCSRSRRCRWMRRA